MDVSYHRALQPGEVVLWRDDAQTDAADDVFACSDIELATDEGALDDIGPRSDRAGYFGGCYG